MLAYRLHKSKQVHYYNVSLKKWNIMQNLSKISKIDMCCILIFFIQLRLQIIIDVVGIYRVICPKQNVLYINCCINVTINNIIFKKNNNPTTTRLQCLHIFLKVGKTYVTSYACYCRSFMILSELCKNLGKNAIIIKSLMTSRVTHVACKSWFKKSAVRY